MDRPPEKVSRCRRAVLALLLLSAGSAASGAPSATVPSAMGAAAQGAPEGLAALLDTSDPERVDALMAPLLERHSLPALGGAIVRSGRLTALGVAGVRRVGAEEPVTVEDLWHLGSCTKAMTATLVGRLVERGLLRFEMTLGEALGGDGDLELDPAWLEVELGDLLRHRGGAPADLGRDGLWAELWRREGSPREQRQRLLGGVLSRPPAVDPGSLLYSNAGYAIAGALAERATGRDFERLLLEEILAPLGALRAGFGSPGTSGSPDQPRGHRAVGEELVAVEPGPLADNPPAIAPAGTAHASLEDWARFVALHLSAARGEARLLDAATFAELHRPVGQHASGWLVVDRAWAGGRVLTHAGSNTMWYAVVWIAPERDLALFAVTNRGGEEAARGCDAAIQALLSRALESGTAPEPGGAGR